jgi:hypothetical protein
MCGWVRFGGLLGLGGGKFCCFLSALLVCLTVLLWLWREIRIY